jgi:hypothetical protein
MQRLCLTGGQYHADPRGAVGNLPGHAKINAYYDFWLHGFSDHDQRWDFPPRRPQRPITCRRGEIKGEQSILYEATSDNGKAIGFHATPIFSTLSGPTPNFRERDGSTHSRARVASPAERIGAALMQIKHSQGPIIEAEY